LGEGEQRDEQASRRDWNWGDRSPEEARVGIGRDRYRKRRGKRGIGRRGGRCIEGGRYEGSSGLGVLGVGWRDM
jgi:hypothetical protein